MCVRERCCSVLLRGVRAEQCYMWQVCVCVCVCIYEWKIQTWSHTWDSLSSLLFHYINTHFFLTVCVCVFLSLCLSLFPVLCFKAEACVTHSTWHMKPLSCLEPGVREKEGERREERGMWMWGVDGWNEGDLSLSLSLSLSLCLFVLLYTLAL